MPRVAVIGAGLAGLTCAKQLQTEGCEVVVLEKSRGAGGRLSTRRTAQAQYDHGAQYFTARDPDFAAFIDQMCAQGAVAPWQPRLRQPINETWYVGTPGMSALGRAQAQGLDVRMQTRVTALVRQGDHWQLDVHEGQSLEGFDVVVVAIPNEQAQVLLQAHAAPWADELGSAPMLPCWTMMLSTAQELCALDADTPRDSAIGWWARNSSKPARAVLPNRHDWVVQATPAWTQAQLETAPEAVSASLIEAFTQSIEVAQITPIEQPSVHRWLYARRTPGLPAAEPTRWSSALGLGVCGDGLSHSRVEQAYLSGFTLAQQIAGQA